MPELIEVEGYRRVADETVGRTVAEVTAPDDWYLKGGLDAGRLTDAVLGATVQGTRRIGKLLLIELADEVGERPTLGLRFGMTGRLLLDGKAAFDHLEYGSTREVPAWDRFGLGFSDGSHLVIRDPRRLGGVLLDPDEARLGVDALDVTPELVDAVLSTSRAPLKARLMDQGRIAGLGNLLTDDVLWRAGLSPLRPAQSLAVTERRALTDAIRCTVRELTDRGGSHTGELQSERHPGGVCPLDGAPLTRSEVGGRTTWWCAVHQS